MFFGMGYIKRMVIREIDIAKTPDGVYRGSFHKNRWNYDLEITIQSHKITDVKITNKSMENFKEFNDKVISTLMEKQKIPFDIYKDYQLKLIS
jgi:uncharacterized protein with FMN-binding domain